MLSLDAILLQSLVARPYGILKLFPDHVRANERTTHLHTFIDNNSFPKHSHRVRVRDDVYFSANLISIFQWWSSKLCSVSSKLWWVRSPLSALKLYRFFFTFTSHFSPSSNVFPTFFLIFFPCADIYSDFFPASWVFFYESVIGMTLHHTNLQKTTTEKRHFLWSFSQLPLL